MRFIKYFTEWILAKLFPPRLSIKPEEIDHWRVYEVSNHSDIDPHRPLERYETYAGNIKSGRISFQTFKKLVKNQ